MGDKIVLVGRKLGMSGRKLVTTAGGAPCCCGGVDPLCPNSGAGCKDCLVNEYPILLNDVAYTPAQKAAAVAALDAAFSGFSCAAWEPTRVQIPAWSFSTTNDFYGSISATFPEMVLCRVAPGPPSRGMSHPWRDWGASSGVWWNHPTYGYAYSPLGSVVYGVGTNQVVCAWEGYADIGTGVFRGITAEQLAGVVVSFSSPFGPPDYETPTSTTEQATYLYVRAELVRVTDVARQIFTELYDWEYIAGVVLVVQYEIITPHSGFYVVPSPDAVQGTGQQTLTDLPDWGGWVSCTGVRAGNGPAPDQFNVQNFAQTIRPCSPTGGCGQVFKPKGVTVYQPPGSSGFGFIANNGEPFDDGWFTTTQPDDISWTSFSWTGFEARIIEPYGASCSDPPPDAGLLGLV